MPFAQPRSAIGGSLVPFLSLFVLLVSFSMACVTPEPPDNTGDGGDISDGGTDGGDTDGGDDGGVVEPTGCSTDLSCEPGEYCDRASGDCRPAKACQTNDDCDWQEDPSVSDYCVDGACFCDTDWNDGSCRPRLARCEPCTRDVECGDDPFVHTDYVAGCVEFDGEKVCLPKKPKCGGGGYVPDTASAFCRPVGGSCSGLQPCTVDADCDPMSERPVCNQLNGTCEAACEFDYATGHSNCGPDQVCHVDARLLSGTNPNFGAGKCGRHCDLPTNPFICAPGTKCVEDGDPMFIFDLPNRCRPELPSCVRDADCPEVPEDFSTGWCDRGTLTCKGGCQVDSHCSTAFRCVDGACVERTCIERGGANLACDIGQFCCGEENSVSCPTGQAAGKCYDAPSPPWCGTCDGNNKQSAITPAGVARPQSSVCLPTKNPRDENAPAQPMQWHACDPLGGQMCPRAHECMGYLQFCDTDADCGGVAKCNDVGSGYGDHKACVFENPCDEANDSCPAPSSCYNQKDENGETTLSYCRAHWCSPLECFPEPVQQP